MKIEHELGRGSFASDHHFTFDSPFSRTRGWDGFWLGFWLGPAIVIAAVILR